jgi:hypothetical protein
MPGHDDPFLSLLEMTLPRQPLRDALLRIGTRFGVGAEMATFGQSGIGGAGDRVRR